MSNEANAQRKRDARLRYHLLSILHRQRSNQHGGWVRGRLAVDALGWTDPIEDDDHAIALFRDLVNKGYAEEEDNREDRSQPWGLDFLTFKVTGLGSSFMTRATAPDADIDDGRILKPR